MFKQVNYIFYQWTFNLQKLEKIKVTYNLIYIHLLKRNFTVLNIRYFTITTYILTFGSKHY